MIRTQSGGTWQSEGDPNAGTLSINPDLGIAVVRQSLAVHRSIAKLLQNLRNNLTKSLKATGGTVFPSNSLDRVEMRFYTVDNDAKAKQLAAAIPVLVEPQS